MEEKKKGEKHTECKVGRDDSNKVALGGECNRKSFEHWMGRE